MKGITHTWRVGKTSYNISELTTPTLFTLACQEDINLTELSLCAWEQTLYVDWNIICTADLHGLIRNRR